MGGRGAGSGLGGAQRDIENIIDWLSGESGKGGKINPIDINKYQGQSLEKIENRIRNLAHEELFAFDNEGKLIEAYKGDSQSVSFPVSLLYEKDATVTHGHPKGVAEFGGTFSFADIDNMLQSNWKEHRATASGQGEMNYIMRCTQNADPQGLRNRINKDYWALQNKITDTYKKEYQNAIQTENRKQAMHIARQQAVGVLNAYYKETFSQYGYEYITRKTDYKYNR